MASLQSNPSDSNGSKGPAFLKRGGTGTSTSNLKPWSAYTPSDYTVNQYHKASLIHNHDGPPTSKDQCKLPIKTPNGMVHPGGVMAAAAALAGSRGGVQASTAQKISAAKTLIGHYNKFNREPPDSLKKLAHGFDIENFLEHHGVRGQKWGFRHPRNSGNYPLHGDSKTAARLKSRPVHSLSNHELQTLNKRSNLEQEHRRLNPSTIDRGEKAAKRLVAVAGTAVALKGIFGSSAGKKALALGEKHLVNLVKVKSYI